MQYEGSEKKAEVRIDNDCISLLNDLDDTFWHQLVIKSNAKILSKISNQDCVAYLLSESSLFVWDDRFLIITCGETQTINSVEYFIEKIGKDKIIDISYQRKNEYFSHAQPSSFIEDSKRLSKTIKGKAYRFGDLDGHHHFIFQQFHKLNALEACSATKNQCETAKEQKHSESYEYMAYHIDSDALDILSAPSIKKENIRALLRTEKLLTGFIIDDFIFEPTGYSLNAIKGNKYLTIHVTPQIDSSYVSIEANFDFLDYIAIFTDILKPRSFDLLIDNVVNSEQKINGASNISSNSYIRKSLVSKILANGRSVFFAHLIQPANTFSEALEIDI